MPEVHILNYRDHKIVLTDGLQHPLSLRLFMRFFLLIGELLLKTPGFRTSNKHALNIREDPALSQSSKHSPHICGSRQLLRGLNKQHDLLEIREARYRPSVPQKFID